MRSLSTDPELNADSERARVLFERQRAALAVVVSERVPVSDPCNCIGPQGSAPLCPCAMRGVIVRDGRYVLPERDLGPVT